MKVAKSILLAFLFILPVALLAGCTEEDNTPDWGTDVPVDHPADTPVDVPADVPVDRPPDTTPDTPVDVPVDRPPDVTPDVTPDITPDITPDTGTCTHDYGTLTITEALCQSDGTSYIYQGVYEGSSTTPPVAVLGVETWPDFGGPSAPGSYTFNDTNYDSCGLCGIVMTGCTETACEKSFLITSGSITITELGAVGGNFAATVSNLSGIEVTIDSTTFTSTPVPGGETWCADAATLSATVTEPTG